MEDEVLKRLADLTQDGITITIDNGCNFGTKFIRVRLEKTVEERQKTYKMEQVYPYDAHFVEKNKFFLLLKYMEEELLKGIKEEKDDNTL